MNYKCPYCKKEYENPTDMANCIIKCDKENKLKEEQERKLKLSKVKDERLLELQNEYNSFKANVEKFENDYGESIVFRSGGHTELFPSLIKVYDILGII